MPIDQGKELDIAGLKKYLSLTLPGYMIPSFFVSIAAIPLTTSGKPDRQALPTPGIKIGEKYVSPGSEIEKIIGRVLEKIGLFPVSIDESSHFFMQKARYIRAFLIVSIESMDFLKQLYLYTLFSF